MDDDNKSMRNQREAASWQSSTLTIPAIILAVILLMVGSTVMSKMTPPATPTPAPSAATAAPAPDAAAMRQMNQRRDPMQKTDDPVFMAKYHEKAKQFKGDYSKLTPAERGELETASQGHGKQFFEMMENPKRQGVSGPPGGPP